MVDFYPDFSIFSTVNTVKMCITIINKRISPSELVWLFATIGSWISKQAGAASVSQLALLYAWVIAHRQQNYTLDTEIVLGVSLTQLTRAFILFVNLIRKINNILCFAETPTKLYGYRVFTRPSACSRIGWMSSSNKLSFTLPQGPLFRSTISKSCN